MTGRRLRDSAGVTLVELVVTLAIVLTAATLVLPAIGRGTEALRLRSEAGRVAALLREARLRAITQHRPTHVELDRARSTVALTVGEAAEPARRVDLPPGLRLSAAEGFDRLTFSPRGLTRDTRWIVEGAGQRRLAIEVAGVSGRVTVAVPSRP